MSTTAGVVRQSAAGLEVVAADPGGPLAAMSRALVERAATHAALAPGVWRIEVTTSDPVEVRTTRLADADARVAVALVERTSEETVTVREVVLSPSDALSADALGRWVSDGVAAATGDIPVGEVRLVELVELVELLAG